MVRTFIKDESGLETVEYAVMMALIVSAMVVALTALGGAMTARFASTQGVISGLP